MKDKKHKADELRQHSGTDTATAAGYNHRCVSQTCGLQVFLLFVITHEVFLGLLWAGPSLHYLHMSRDFLHSFCI